MMTRYKIASYSIHSSPSLAFQAWWSAPFPCPLASPPPTALLRSPPGSGGGGGGCSPASIDSNGILNNAVCFHDQQWAATSHHQRCLPDCRRRNKTSRLIAKLIACHLPAMLLGLLERKRAEVLEKPDLISEAKSLSVALKHFLFL